MITVVLDPAGSLEQSGGYTNMLYLSEYMIYNTVVQ